jgi:hypothetical protein
MTFTMKSFRSEVLLSSEHAEAFFAEPRVGEVRPATVRFRTCHAYLNWSPPTEVLPLGRSSPESRRSLPTPGFSTFTSTPFD